MNPARLLVLLVSLPLFFVGCGEKDVSTNETKPVEEKEQKIKEEVNPVEAIAETKPKAEGVNAEELEERLVDGIFMTYYKGSDTLYTGKAFGLHENGQKRWEANYKDGKEEGLRVEWYDTGEKTQETNFKDGWEEGLRVGYYKNGQKSEEENFKNGNQDGLHVMWHENGQKMFEANWKDDKILPARKYWDSKGEPVGSLKEAKAE